jgi:hypothetical protein
MLYTDEQQRNIVFSSLQYDDCMTHASIFSFSSECLEFHQAPPSTIIIDLWATWCATTEAHSAETGPNPYHRAGFAI